MKNIYIYGNEIPFLFGKKNLIYSVHDQLDWNACGGLWAIQ